jgi:lysyl-tRNA synthetase class 2
MDEHGFLEVETPVLQPEAGGALARPFVTHHQALDCDLYLRIALELHLKRLIIGGFDRVYEIGRIFRNEGISTRHNPEFTMMESYQAYADYRDVMAFVEEMVSGLVAEINGASVVIFGGQPIDFTPPWPRLTMRDAVQQYAGLDFLQFPDPPSLVAELEIRGLPVDPTKDWGRLLDEIVSRYVEPHLVQPTFIYDFPLEVSPLSKQKPEDPNFVERFELYIGGFEIANAFSELNDPSEQRDRFEYQQLLREKGDLTAHAIDEDYIRALSYGLPPTAGEGIGIDRLTMLLTNSRSIRDVILFPLLRPEKPPA